MMVTRIGHRFAGRPHFHSFDPEFQFDRSDHFGAVPWLDEENTRFRGINWKAYCRNREQYSE
jgi:hypothetical protein